MTNRKLDAVAAAIESRVGAPVLYYRNGWHFGHVKSWGRKWVRILHPLGHSIKTTPDNVKEYHA